MFYYAGPGTPSGIATGESAEDGSRVFLTRALLKLLLFDRVPPSSTLYAVLDTDCCPHTLPTHPTWTRRSWPHPALYYGPEHVLPMIGDAVEMAGGGNVVVIAGGKSDESVCETTLANAGMDAPTGLFTYALRAEVHEGGEDVMGLDLEELVTRVGLRLARAHVPQTPQIECTDPSLLNRPLFLASGPLSPGHSHKGPNSKSGPSLGMMVGDVMDNEGVLVLQIVPQGPADTAGIQVGDVIDSLSHKATRTASEFAECAKTAMAWGAALPITLFRGHGTQERRDREHLKMMLMLPVNPAVEDSISSWGPSASHVYDGLGGDEDEDVDEDVDGLRPFLGLTVGPWTKDSGGGIGVEVTSVEHEGPAWLGGLKVGDCIEVVARRRVRGVGDWAKIVAKVALVGIILPVIIRRDSGSQTLHLEVDSFPDQP